MIIILHRHYHHNNDNSPRDNIPQAAAAGDLPLEQLEAELGAISKVRRYCAAIA